MAIAPSNKKLKKLLSAKSLKQSVRQQLNHKLGIYEERVKLIKKILGKEAA